MIKKEEWVIRYCWYKFIGYIIIRFYRCLQKQLNDIIEIYNVLRY